MSTFTPSDWIELVKQVFVGLALICIPVSTGYTILTAARAKRSEDASLLNAASIQKVSTNVDRLEKNTNSISERNQAIAMKLGITEGIAQERASVQANAAATLPLPVSDEKTAAAVDRVVDAIHTTKGLTP